VTKGPELSLNGDAHLCPEDLIWMIRQPTRTQTHQTTAWQDFCKEKYTMLWTIFLVLLVLWLVGFIGFHVVAWYIHILLIIALVVLVIQLVGGRRAI
jgi:fatty acid desaturase